MVLMDLIMPEKDGYDATFEIRKIERESGRSAVFICGFSAMVNEEIEMKCRKYGMNHVVMKPISKAQLEELLHDARKANHELTIV